MNTNIDYHILDEIDPREIHQVDMVEPPLSDFMYKLQKAGLLREK